MQTRRTLLLAGAALAVVGIPAWGFDGDRAPLRYRTWLAKFKRDLERLSSEPNGETKAFESRVSAACEESIVPHSRMAYTVGEWLKDTEKSQSARHGAMHYASLGDVVLMLLEKSIPPAMVDRFPNRHEVNSCQFGPVFGTCISVARIFCKPISTTRNSSPATNFRHKGR